MPVERVYIGDDTQYFPDLNRWVDPGDTVEFDEAPVDDPRFATAAAAKKHRHPEPEAPAENEEQA